MSALPKKLYTLEEYIELEKNSEERYEFFEGTVRGLGEVFAMAGGSPNHARISGNVYAEIQRQLKGTSCEAFNSDIRVFVPRALPYRYPDVSVVCGEPVFDDFQGQQRLVNPVVLIEVLSATTADYDRDEKFTEYQSIESFREYLLISQKRPHVIQYVRQSDGKWLRSDLLGLNTSVMLDAFNVTLPLSEIYQRVTFA